MIWKISDAIGSEEYKLYSCQFFDGKKCFRLVKVRERYPGEAILTTMVVPSELLKKRDLIAI